MTLWTSTISFKKNLCKISMSSFTEVRLCRGINFGEVFYPRRKDQVLYSRERWLRYFDIVRELWMLILKKRMTSSTRRDVSDELLKELQSEVEDSDFENG